MNTVLLLTVLFPGKALKQTWGERLIGIMFLFFGFVEEKGDKYLCVMFFRLRVFFSKVPVSAVKNF